MMFADKRWPDGANLTMYSPQQLRYIVEVVNHNLNVSLYR